MVVIFGHELIFQGQTYLMTVNFHVVVMRYQNCGRQPLRIQSAKWKTKTGTTPCSSFASDKFAS